VIAGSSWRSEPAAPLRGFASGFSPEARARSLKTSNARHDHLATHFEHARPVVAAQAQRNGLYRAQVGGDILAYGTVAACGALHEHAVFVAQADGQPVELRLHREDRLLPPERVLDAAFEIGHFTVFLTIGVALLLESVAEREHRHGVHHLREPPVRAGADAARGRVFARQIRVLVLQCFQLAHQPVVLGIGNVRIVQHVVAVVRVFDQSTQGLCALDGFDGGGGLGHVQGP